VAPAGLEPATNQSARIISTQNRCRRGAFRRAGGGRRAGCDNDPGLVPALERLVAPATLGDPMRPLIWVRPTVRNVLSAFEFSQKIAQAKDVEELIQMQTEFIRSQIQVLNDQVKDLGESATKTGDTATTAVSERVNALGKNAEAA
jgi:Phasin protein